MAEPVRVGAAQPEPGLLDAVIGLRLDPSRRNATWLQDFSMSMFQLMPNLSVSQPEVPQG